MSEISQLYCVLLAEPEHLRLPELSSALAAFKKIRLHEAARLARSAWGFAGEDLPQSQARELCLRLKEAGLEGLVLSKTSVVELAQAVGMVQAELAHEGIWAIFKSGEKSLIPWGRLVLIAAAGFETITQTSKKIEQGLSIAQKAANIGFMMATGLPIPIAGKKQEATHTERRTEIMFYLDLYESPPLKHWRIDAQDFNYSCLKERKAYNVFMNFRTLTSMLARQAPQALKNTGARLLAQGENLTSAGYAAFSDLDKESRWLLTAKLKGTF